jgi:proline dehydrogenase
MSLARSALIRASRSTWLAGQFRRRGFGQRAVRRFMPGEAPGAALDAAARLAAIGIGSVLTALGERVTTESEADRVRDEYCELLEAVRARGLDSQLSVKLSHLGLDIDRKDCLGRVEEIAAVVADTDSFLWLDIEESASTDVTIATYRAVRTRTDRVGICLQAYLRRTPRDLDSLLALKPAVRLVKGAYDEPDHVAFASKRDTDRAYLALADQLLLAAPDGTLPVFGTHDLRMIERIRQIVATREIPDRAYEVHMLYGIQSDAQRPRAPARGYPSAC